MSDHDINTIAQTAVQSLPPHIREAAGDVMRCTLRTQRKRYDAELDVLRAENARLTVELQQVRNALKQAEEQIDR